MVVASYGTQSNTYGVSVPERNLQEIFGKIEGWKDEGWKDEGYNVIFCSDTNVQAGSVHIPNNDPILTPVGKIFNDLMEGSGLTICNNMCDDPTTFTDLRSGRRRA